MVISRSTLLVCFLLATTVTLSWGKRASESELDNGSGTTEETLLSDDEDFNFGLSDDGNDVTTTFDDDEDNEQVSSGDGDDDEPSTTFPEDDEESEGSGDPDDEETVKKNIMNTKTADSSEEDDDTSEPPVLGTGNEVTEPTNDNISTSHFLAALIAGGAVGLLFALCVIMLLAYRIRKKDEGSYALDEQKKKPASPNAYQYTQGQEYYA